MGVEIMTDQRASKNVKEQFIRMIYESFNSDNNGLGTLGEILLTKADQITTDLKTTESVIAEEEVIHKIKEFKEAENNSNLVWMDYNSWNLLPESFRNLVKSTLDPLFWTGVFFRYDLFMLHEEVLMSNLDQSGYLYLLTEHKNNYLLVWVACDSVYFDWIHDTKMKDFNASFLTRILRSYGVDGEGKIVTRLPAPKEKTIT